MFVLSGCVTVGPDYVRPDRSLSATWHSELKDGLIAGEMNPQTLAAWWTILKDPELSSLIDRAVSGNLDLKKARARIREARARRGIARADLFPPLDATGAATWSRTGKDTGSGKTNDLYSANFDAGWELDIFGGVRRSVEAAEADVQASEEDLRDVLVSLLAETALNYIDVRTSQVRIAVAEANLESQSETYRLTQWRYEAGLSDELAVQQARYSLENTRSLIPALRTGTRGSHEPHRRTPGRTTGQGPVGTGETGAYSGHAVEHCSRCTGRPSEASARCATGRAGAGCADSQDWCCHGRSLPQVKLSGSIGLEALSSSGIWTASGGPGISWTIFKGGAIRQNIEVQSALQEQYLIAYEAALLSALEEVENALVAYVEVQRQMQSLSEATQAARKAVELAQHKYQAGLTDFNNVLDAQRSLLSFQEQLAQSEGNVASNLVRLYKALGGGWESIYPDEENSKGAPPSPLLTQEGANTSP